MGLGGHKDLYADSTDYWKIFVSSPHPHLSGIALFALVESSHLAGFSRELTRISFGGAILRWRGTMGLAVRNGKYAVCTD